VVFWLGAGTGVADSFLERDGSKPFSIPYELLVESESSLVVISPKDGQRANEFDRKAVGGLHCEFQFSTFSTLFYNPLRRPRDARSSQAKYTLSPSFHRERRCPR
jgi:hypothetical protein